MLFLTPEVLVWFEQGLPTLTSEQLVLRWLFQFNLMLEKFSKQDSERLCQPSSETDFDVNPFVTLRGRNQI